MRPSGGMSAGVVALAVVLLGSLLTVPRVTSTNDPVPVGTAAPAYPAHPPILIEGDANFTAGHGVTRGSGTPGDPYVIENWDLNASRATGLTLFNTSAYLLIRHVSIHGGWNHTASNVSQLHRGIYMVNAAHVRIENSTVYDNDDGFLFWSALELGIEHCVFYGNAGIGVDGYGSHVVIANNTFHDQGLGYRGGGTDILVAGNDFYRNDPGALMIDYGANITVRDNNLADLKTHSIEVDSGSNITFFHNNILNEFPLEFGIPNGTRWDAGYPAGGNFWGTYHGTDNCTGPAQDVCTGGDGIGDTPFTGYLQVPYGDRYPLIHPYGGATSVPSATFAVEPAVLHPSDLVTVNASASHDPGGPDGALTFRWRWGDGSVNESWFDGWDTFWSDSPTNGHRYPQPGSYRIDLQVRGMMGWTNVSSLVITVTPVPFDWGPWIPTFVLAGAIVILGAVWAGLRVRNRRRPRE